MESKRPPVRTAKYNFTGIPQRVSTLLKRKQKEMASHIKAVAVFCHRCDMKIVGDYPKHEAVIMEKEFLRIHGEHDIVKKSLLQRIREVIHL